MPSSSSFLRNTRFAFLLLPLVVGACRWMTPYGSSVDESTASVRGPFVFTCGGNAQDTLVVTYFAMDPSNMIATRGDETLRLAQVRSASGAHYEGQGASFWEHQGEVALEWNDAPDTTCVPRDMSLFGK